MDRGADVEVEVLRGTMGGIYRPLALVHVCDPTRAAVMFELEFSLICNINKKTSNGIFNLNSCFWFSNGVAQYLVSYVHMQWIQSRLWPYLYFRVRKRPFLTVPQSSSPSICLIRETRFTFCIRFTCFNLTKQIKHFPSPTFEILSSLWIYMVTKWSESKLVHGSVVRRLRMTKYVINS